MEGLIKCTETKGVDQNTTLLHYLVSTISTKNPDLLELTTDLKSVKLAAKISIPAIRASFNELQLGLDKMLQAVHRILTQISHGLCQAHTTPSEGTLGECLKISTEKLVQLDQSLSNLDLKVQLRVSTGELFGYIRLGRSLHTLVSKTSSRKSHFESSINSSICLTLQLPMLRRPRNGVKTRKLEGGSEVLEAPPQVA